MFLILGIPCKHIEQLKFEDFILAKDKIKEKQSSLQVKQIEHLLIKFQKLIYKNFKNN